MAEPNSTIPACNHRKNKPLQCRNVERSRCSSLLNHRFVISVWIPALKQTSHLSGQSYTSMIAITSIPSSQKLNEQVTPLTSFNSNSESPSEWKCAFIISDSGGLFSVAISSPVEVQLADAMLFPSPFRPLFHPWKAHCQRYFRLETTPITEKQVIKVRCASWTAPLRPPKTCDLIRIYAFTCLISN